MASALLFAVSVLYLTNLQWYFLQAENPSPKFLTTVTNVTVNKGSLAELPCPVQNIGTETVTWRRASSSAPLTVGAFTFTSDIRISVTQPPAQNLHIRNVSPDDAGLYICAVTKRNLSHAVALTVQGIEISGPGHLETGQALRVVCNATGDGYSQYDIDWFKDGIRITPDDRLLITTRLSTERRTITSDLSIDTVGMADAGTYVCRTSDNQITHYSLFIFKGRISITGPQYVEEGHAFRLVCSAAGAVYPQYDVDWFKDGGRITSDDRLLITRGLSRKSRTFTSDLYIDRAKMADAGTYVCRAEDDQITSTRLTIFKGKCPEGKHGLKCTISCGHCKGGSPCMKSSGNCPNGCEPGWDGAQCKEECLNGTFGENCQCCDGSVCDKMTGQCPHENVTGRDTSVTTGLCVMFIILAILLAVAIFVIYRRHRQQRVNDKPETPKKDAMSFTKPHCKPLVTV